MVVHNTGCHFPQNPDDITRKGAGLDDWQVLVLDMIVQYVATEG